jgi:hypothetical protein
MKWNPSYFEKEEVRPGVVGTFSCCSEEFSMQLF